MKKIYICAFISVIILGFGSYSFAAINHASGAKINLTSGVTKSINAFGFTNLGMNYGNLDVFSAPYNSARVNSDLSTLYASGFRNIRVALPDWTGAGGGGTGWTPAFGTSTVIAIATQARADGFYVFCGLDSVNTTLTSSNEVAWMLAVENFSINANGICNEYEVGNEEEAHHDGTLTDAQIRNDIRSMATVVKGQFTGAITYSVSNNTTYENEWIADGNIGNLTQLDLNVYGSGVVNDYTTFQSQITAFKTAFPTMQITEYNINSTCPVVPSTISDATYATQISIRTQILRNLAIAKAYFFTYTQGNDQCVVKFQNGNFSQAYDVLVNYADGLY